MARREFLMQAKVFDPTRHNVGGWYMSEKLDGTRCFWDGGISRSQPTVSIPWAGIIDPRTGQRKKNIKPTATGLWSRYGNPIIAPDWFLNTLPCCPLDGELWAGRGNYQRCRSIVGKHDPISEEWREIQFAVFSTPEFKTFMGDGEVRNANQKTDLRYSDFTKWASRLDPDIKAEWVNLKNPGGPASFSMELAYLSEWIDITSENMFLIQQTKLPNNHSQAAETIRNRMRAVITEGGEGLVLRDPAAPWTPKRVHTVLKIKAALDDEAVVVGFTSGRRTNKGSKLLGKIGALVLDYSGKRLELSGLTDAEREWATADMSKYASDFAGEEMPPHFEGKYFRKGDKVTFTYRELTDDGLPKEARYLRIRTD